MSIEIHPFEDFVPENIKYLVLGSFTSKDSRKGVEYDWYYSNGRNQFWQLIERVYGRKFDNKVSKMALFRELQMGVTDIIQKCNRVKFTSLDNDLEIIELNSRLADILNMDLEAVYFTSRYVEQLFYKHFSELVAGYPKTKFIYLPSPSPRYATMSKDQKVKEYRNLLPRLI